MLRLLLDVLPRARDDESSQKITILLSILEPLIINDQNLEMAFQNNIITLLLQFLDVSYLTEKPQVYIKFGIRCLTSCLRHEQGVQQAINSQVFIDTLILIQRTVKDEEILANACKSMRILMRDD